MSNFLSLKDALAKSILYPHKYNFNLARYTLRDVERALGLKGEQPNTTYMAILKDTKHDHYRAIHKMQAGFPSSVWEFSAYIIYLVLFEGVKTTLDQKFIQGMKSTFDMILLQQHQTDLYIELLCGIVQKGEKHND